MPDTTMSISSSPAAPLGTCLVVGGCGFLGRHLVQDLLNDKSCTSIAVMSRSPFTPRFENVTYYIGDITQPKEVQLVMEQVKPVVVFNTASPHAYIDHEHAHEYFTVNVDGNKTLLASAAAVGTVKAYVYTSSAPIIAGPGGAYALADETVPTIAVTGKGDPYHVAKAIGDKLVLEANGKNGIYTVCIRPTALYGDGDEQMMPATLQVVRDGFTRFWMGNNTCFMDVVYVGHVARAEVLAAHTLVARAAGTHSLARKVDGEAFNVTDDEPQHPWTFFGLFWAAAGAETPLSEVWKIPAWLVMAMAHSAEFAVWFFSNGKKRPAVITKERMEFCLLTRTYSIEKLKAAVGFVPWVDQPYKGQVDAVRGTVAKYIKENAFMFAKGSTWPEHPFKLITETGANEKFGLGTDHYCIENAQLMALIHNTMFRALNAIYYQADLVQPGTQDAIDFLYYCGIVSDFIHHHHVFEESMYFPDIEHATGSTGLMKKEIAEHENIDVGLDKLRRYAEMTRAEKYSGQKLRSIIDSFAVGLQKHMHSEIDTIVGLHNKITSKQLRNIYEKQYEAVGHHSDIFKAGPFVFGCQDSEFLLDGRRVKVPEPFYVPYAINWLIAARYRNLWRFNPSDFYGQPRQPGLIPAKPCAGAKVNSLLRKLGLGFSSILFVLVVWLAYLMTRRFVISLTSSFSTTGVADHMHHV